MDAEKEQMGQKCKRLSGARQVRDFYILRAPVRDP